MKVLLVNSFDQMGGAARAAYRLHKGLQGMGVESAMLVKDKQSDDPSVFAAQGKLAKGINQLRPFLDNLPRRRYGVSPTIPWGNNWLPNNLHKSVDRIDPDIVHLHWIGSGFVPTAELGRFRRPIVWTLHDPWAFTGGCHFIFDCQRYREACGKCPQLNSNKFHDLSHRVWTRKYRHWAAVKDKMVVVTPSHWLADCARQSSLFQDVDVRVIPNGIDTNRFRPLASKIAREILGLPQDKKLILFGAVNSTSDKRKGFQYLQPALKLLAETRAGEVEVLVLGASQPASPPDLGLKAHYLGTLYDDVSLVLLYAAADIFVAPSIEENLSNMVIEALACGTPVVAFNIGGMPDMLEHQANGYLVEPFIIEDLARGMEWTIDKQNKLISRARAKVLQEFSLEQSAAKYADLYHEILGKKGNDK